jgi:Ferric reductase like transmembrane component
MAGRGDRVTALGVNSSALWYLTRATGVVSLLLLTASVALGVAGAVGWSTPRWPRFLTTGLHRNVSLLVLALLTVHIGTAVADSYAPITLVEAVIPFTSAYRPIWLGLGALAFDLLLAILLTSLIRGRLGFRAWRTVHWLAYASWPVALVHGLGTGTDAKSTWMLAVTIACVAAVLGCVWWRIGASLLAGGHRTAAVAASVLVPLAVSVWSITGPLQAGWARRAGTPVALIRSARLGRSPIGSPAPPFKAQVVGRLTQTALGQTGVVTVTVAARVSKPQHGSLRVTLQGQPLPDGSIEIASGNVAFGPHAAPTLYDGAVLVAPDGRLVSRVTGGRQPLDLRLQLTVDHATGAVHGLLDADAAAGDAPTPPGTDNDAHEASI